MAFERAPIFKFDAPESTGVEQVPVGSMIVVESTSEVFTKNKEITGTNITVKTAVDDGVMTTNVSNQNIFNFLYYADEQDSTPENPNGTNSRVLGMNPLTMKLEKEIKLTPYAHPGSCDRAAFSDKMYVRTATTTNEDNTAMSTTGGDRYLEVVDMVAGRKLRKIPFNWKPRSSGAYNRYRDMHAVTTKEFPWIHLIDCPTDKIVFSAGTDTPTYSDPQGNDGGNATGHAVWLDANHFALLDRMNVNIQIYKVEDDYPPYNVTLTQTIPTPSGCHSLRSFAGGFLLEDRTFFAAIEGSYNEAATGGVEDSPPEMWKMTFNSADGKFHVDVTLTEPVTGSSNVNSVVFNTAGCGVGGVAADDNIHHFGCGTMNGKQIIAVPLTRTNTVRIIDVSTWVLEPLLMPSVGYYTVGGGGPVKAGHAEMYMNDKTDNHRVITTNHSGKTVSIIDLKDKTVTDVPIPSLASGYVEGSGFTMSHANHVIGDNYYFFDAYYNETTGHKGTFYELDIVNKVITRSCVTGGHPVQSIS